MRFLFRTGAAPACAFPGDALDVNGNHPFQAAPWVAALLVGGMAAAEPPAALGDGSGSGPSAVFALWDPETPWPSVGERRRPAGAFDVVVHRADEEHRFLHDNAVVWHDDTLFAAWYNCPRAEMQEASAIRGRRSPDGGKTWSPVEAIVDDRAGKGILYVPVAFLSHGGTLYAYVTNMVGPDLVVNCEVFVLDETVNRWRSRGFVADMFLPNCAPVRMADGNFIMAGRVADRPRTKPEWPAVAVSDGENVARPWTVVRLMEGRLPPFPETTVWVDGANLTAVVREPSGGRVFTSGDYGRNWAGPMPTNLPVEHTKLYAGLLSTGQRYLVWNVPPKPGTPRRNELVLGVSRPGEKRLAAVWQLRHGPSKELGVGPEWSYPCAVEHRGKLYVIYTSEKRHSVMTVIPVASLAVDVGPD
jgi:hypothetical protein